MEPSSSTCDRTGVAVSVVVPVYDEAESLPELHRRVRAVLDRIGEPAEIVFVNDGSRDGSGRVLEAIRVSDPTVTVVDLAYNSGQHAAVLAGFRVSRGEVVVTLDADLQNPPEEIPKLLAKVREGYEVVGGIRQGRRDPWLRRLASSLVRWIGGASEDGPVDYGCMLRAYDRKIVRRLLRCRERSPFLPMLARSLSSRATDVPVAHEARRFGRSRYDALRLLRLGFDFITGFSILPIQLISLFGILTAAAGSSFGLYLFLRRLVGGPEANGVFTLFAVLFLFIGALFVALGVIGEYVARIYAEVRGRPLYTIESVRRGGPGGAPG